ncbi:beta-galactosidase [Flavobacterium sp. MAH-1]|uniref:mannan endo-1,4-beta-mannosidase n=1 Tax=Flavobacterium agri TaxID=2743471 RepID=A0A7Y8Y421_9FLAO|nr:beta-galactosidase [Flavobacterium agri]NUY82195.1 beta-galactosidase [Flavobacterium agri]NYA72219.1 beta-galactosidase [Flavobacterium agri]
MKKYLLLFFICTQLCAQKQFVTVENAQFVKNGKPYMYIGANYWYGALLASKKYGDRERLKRELDVMKSNGITNLRIMVGADGGTYDYTVPYAMQPKQGQYDAETFDGLDYLLSEMEKRNMVAVLYLTNNWEWSGGMAQYLEWNGKDEIPNPNIRPENTWQVFMDYVAQFHTCEPCKSALEQHIRKVLTRTNTYTKKKYTSDPAIMAWQVANEPRIFKVENEAAFTDWLNKTVDLIESLDKNHLICTGSEGSAGSNADINTFERTHNNSKIDYLTMHIWPKNWQWYDHKDEKGTLPVAIEKASKYMEEHIAVATRLKKPIVVEEFGLPRRDESLDPKSNTDSRNAFYTMFFERLAKSKKNGELLKGVNFWGFGGEGVAKNEKGKWNSGDPFTADPPQEPQGLNTVFSSDKELLDIIKNYNARLAN